MDSDEVKIAVIESRTRAIEERVCSIEKEIKDLNRSNKTEIMLSKISSLEDERRQLLIEVKAVPTLIQKLDEVGEALKQLQKDRDKALRYGLVLVGGAFLSALSWIINLATTKLFP